MCRRQADGVGMRFFGVQNFFLDTKDKSDFWDTKMIFLGYKMIFSGYKNLFLKFSEVNGVSSIVELFLTFLEGQKRPVGFNCR